MAHERIKPEFLFDEEKIKQLKQIAPECFEDGKLTFETLRQNLGDWVQDEEDGDLEHFGLFWPGKKDARRLATIPPEGTLEPVYGEGLKSDGTPDDDGVNDSKNIFIEGENLEVLKILQKSYANKIKMIYIDPPYNTGNDFVYDDDFTEPLQEYLRRTGQIDEEGKPLTTNKKSDGRFHSKWLSMIYPRLRLARNLLKDDGVIFVSIDDNEATNLKMVLNEIFGEENFIAQFIHKNNSNKNQAKLVGVSCEYFLCYSKNKDSLQGIEWKVEKKGAADIAKKFKQLKKLDISLDEIEQEIKEMYKRPKYAHLSRWNKVDENGVFKDENLSREGGPKNYTITNPETGEDCVVPPRGWAKSKEDLEKLQQQNLIWYGDPDTAPGWKYYLSEDNYSVPDNFWYYDNSVDTKWIKKEFGDIVFQNPKPVDMIRDLIDMTCDSSDIVMDFFAGSGTTAHALNSSLVNSNGELNYILVQFPEPLEESKKEQKAAFKYCVKENLPYYLTEVTKKRLKKTIKKNNIGTFKVYKLMQTNYKQWNDVQREDISQLENSLDLFNSSPLREDWNKNKLITELMLLEGFPLDASQTKSHIGSNQIVKVESEIVSNTLLICLDDEIEESMIEELELDNASTFICLDSAISNQNKLRLSDKGLIKTI